MTHVRLREQLSASTKPTESKQPINELSDYSVKFAYIEAANEHFQKKQYKLALQKYEEYLKLDPSSIEILFNKAATLMVLARYKEAEKIFKFTVSIKHDDAEMLSFYGIVLLNLAKPKLALEQFNLALRISPNSECTWHKHGLAHHALKNPVAALASFKHALSISPNNETIIDSYHRSEALEKEMSKKSAKSPIVAWFLRKFTSENEVSSNSSSAYTRLAP